MCISYISKECEEYLKFGLVLLDKVLMGHMCMCAGVYAYIYVMFHIWITLALPVG